MRAPPAAIAARLRAGGGSPPLLFAAPRARRGGIAVQVTPVSVSAVIEVGGGGGFSFFHVFLYVMAPP